MIELEIVGILVQCFLVVFNRFETIVYFCLIAELAKQPLIQKTLIALAWASDKPARAS
jgi:hypothetical protein